MRTSALIKVFPGSSSGLENNRLHCLKSVKYPTKVVADNTFAVLPADLKYLIIFNVTLSLIVNGNA